MNYVCKITGYKTKQNTNTNTNEYTPRIWIGTFPLVQEVSAPEDMLKEILRDAHLTILKVIIGSNCAFWWATCTHTYLPSCKSLCAVQNWAFRYITNLEYDHKQITDPVTYSWQSIENNPASHYLTYLEPYNHFLGRKVRDEGVTKGQNVFSRARTYKKSISNSTWFATKL